MTGRIPSAPSWRAHWHDIELAEIADAEYDAREQAFLDEQYERGRAWAASRGPRVHDREWQAGISHSDEFGGHE